MLRQALEGNHNTHDVVDTVETSNETSSLLVPSQQQQQQQQQHQREPGQTSIATPYTDDDDDYGGVEHHNNNFNDNDEEEDGESSDGSYEDDEEEDDDDWSYQSQQPNIARRAWNAIRGLFLLVANVENLWDSPVSTFYGTDVHEHHHNMYGNASSTCSYQQQQHPQLQSQLHHYQSGAAAAAAAEEGAVSSIPRGIHRRRSYFIVLFWFFILAGAYATERCTFKFLVDRAGPFRLFSVEMVTGSHATMLGCWVLGKHMYYRRYQQRSGNTGVIGSINCSSQLPLGISLVDVGCKYSMCTKHYFSFMVLQTDGKMSVSPSSLNYFRRHGYPGYLSLAVGVFDWTLCMSHTVSDFGAIHAAFNGSFDAIRSPGWKLLHNMLSTR